MYLTFREQRQLWFAMYEEIVCHLSTDHIITFSTEYNQAEHLENKLLEAEDRFLIYFWKHVEAVVAMAQATKKWQLPSRYLERIDVKTGSIVESLVAHKRAQKLSGGKLAS
jgi:DNA-binding phage protein